MYECGVDSDQLNLMYKCDAYSKVAVKTPVGFTSRVDRVASSSLQSWTTFFKI